MGLKRERRSCPLDELSNPFQRFVFNSSRSDRTDFFLVFIKTNLRIFLIQPPKGGDQKDLSNEILLDN